MQAAPAASGGRSHRALQGFAVMDFAESFGVQTRGADYGQRRSLGRSAFQFCVTLLADECRLALWNCLHMLALVAPHLGGLAPRNHRRLGCARRSEAVAAMLADLGGGKDCFGTVWAFLGWSSDHVWCLRRAAVHWARRKVGPFFAIPEPLTAAPLGIGIPAGWRQAGRLSAQEKFDDYTEHAEQTTQQQALGPVAILRLRDCRPDSRTEKPQQDCSFQVDSCPLCRPSVKRTQLAAAAWQFGAYALMGVLTSRIV